MQNLQTIENNLSQIPIWEKIPFFYSERYKAAREQKQELQSNIAQLEGELNRLDPNWSIMDFSTSEESAAAQKPSPTLKPTPSPTPTPKSTPTPTPLPEYVRNASVPDNAELTAHWDDFMEELKKTTLDPGGLTIEQRFKIIEESAKYIGKYSYRDDDHPDGKDCADLVKELYKAAGISLHGNPGKHSTSDKIAENVFDNGWGIDKKDLQPGDLIFWDSIKGQGRWKNIHHVGIYLCKDANDTIWIIDSTGSEGGPAVQELWGENKRAAGFKVYGYASPRNIN